jgi:hypothetical protein
MESFDDGAERTLRSRDVRGNIKSSARVIGCVCVFGDVV